MKKGKDICSLLPFCQYSKPVGFAYKLGNVFGMGFPQ